MKIALLTAIASACAAPALVAAHDHEMPNGVIYVFDGDYAGGVSGTIRMDWDAGIMCDRVTVTADLSFKQVDLAALAKADGNCTGRVKEYTYHIHTLWNQPQDYQSSSASYAQCAKSITGNHYDPNKACGPASEYAGTPDCASRVQNYKCTPETYAENVANCEMGDLSGKLGTLKPNKKGILKAKWTDSLYPRWDDHKPTWNIVIHAVCGTATPRVACSVGHKLEAKKKHLKGLKHHYDEGETEANGDDEDKDADDEKDADEDKDGDDDEKDDQRDEDEDEDGDEDDDENNDDDADGKDDPDASDENPFGGIPHKGHDESTIVIKIYSTDDN